MVTLEPTPDVFCGCDTAVVLRVLLDSGLSRDCKSNCQFRENDILDICNEDLGVL